MSLQASVPTQITKTAQDAINAKLSCLEVSYDSVLPGPNRKLYKDLMHQILASDKVKRQSPLVHAGYAIRMDIISTVLKNFIEINSKSPVINVVLLGAGLDPLGLWALSLSSFVQVFEIDCQEICLTKSEILKNKGILTNCKSYENNGTFVLEGMFESMQDCTDGNSSTNTKCNYTLMSANLRNVSSLQHAIQSSNLQNNHPTIILSELVMAYLGKDYVGHLLNYISSSLCLHQSMFVAYEPVYPGGDEASVSSGYAKDYFDQFSCKLEQGKMKHTMAETESSFEPIGTSPMSVMRTLRRQGFDHYIDCSPIASISGFLNTCAISQREPFDEHSALLLHLSCYAMMYATSSDMQGKDIVSICPWTNLFKASKGRGFRIQHFIDTGKRFIFSAIKSQHQKQVQSLFKSAYEHLFHLYPSVKKLVSSALKTDLSTRTNRFDEDNSCTDCCIWNHYSKDNGAFFVILDTKADNECDKVAGCIGVKKCQSNTNFINDHQSTSTHVYYELFRLLVKPEYQGQGFGKALLQGVEAYIHEQEENNVTNNDVNQVMLVANSPEVLEVANKMYIANDFHLQSEQMIGSMNIRLFIKKL
jgi:O-methyltransferase involved in polyketide biosynthesis/ribosomal protein S18 acetylase RimI-like enzyme